MAVSSLNPQLRREVDDLVGSMCKAMNDAKRVLILYALRDGPQPVGVLSDILQVPQANTSQHLAVLRDRQVVDTERRGNSVLYSLRHPKILDAVDILRQVMGDEFARQQGLREP